MGAVATADIIRDGRPPGVADKALKRIGVILAKYPIAPT